MPYSSIYITIGYPCGLISNVTPWIVLNKVSMFLRGTGDTPAKLAKSLRKEIAEQPGPFEMAIGVHKPSELYYEVYAKDFDGLGHPPKFKLIEASDNAPNQPGG